MSDGLAGPPFGETWSGVDERAASPPVAAVFDAIRATLRVPYLGLCWRMLAYEPVALAAAWAAVAPALRSPAAEHLAAVLRDRALISEAAGMSSHKAFKSDLVRAEIDYDLRAKIAAYNAIAHYALPKHLIAMTLLAVPPAVAVAPPSETLPLGVVAGAVAPPPLDPATARGRAATLLPAIAAAHGHPTTEDYFRALAQLPDYLGAAWNALTPVVGDEEYGARATELVERASAGAATLPFDAAPLEALPATPRARVEALAALFQTRLLPATLIDCAIIKALTDGPEAGPRSPFALA